MDTEMLQIIVKQMRSSKVSNYVIAGLDSYLLENGNVRLFECSRNHQDSITPHSHRFDFACLVLSGEVRNRIWTEAVDEYDGDHFESSIIKYTGDIGTHKVKKASREFWHYSDKIYTKGEVYSMTSDQIHSIKFSKDSSVLFFEGPQISETSMIIEPVVNGLKIPTYENRDYMFLTEDDK